MEAMAFVTPALIVGGWACPTEWMAPLASALAIRFRPRLLGLGRLAPGVEGREWRSRLHAEITALSPRPLVVGWSLGGMVALDALADRDAPAVAGVALVGCAARFCRGDGWPWGASAAEVRALRAALRRNVVEALAAFRAQCARPFEMPGEARWRDAAAMAEAWGPEALSAGLSWLSAFDARARIAGAWRWPTVCVHGGADAVVPSAAAEATARRLAVRLEVIPGIGHDMPMRCPHETAEAILRGIGLGE